jgi:hypothetical protein
MPSLCVLSNLLVYIIHHGSENPEIEYKHAEEHAHARRQLVLVKEFGLSDNADVLFSCGHLQTAMSQLLQHWWTVLSRSEVSNFARNSGPGRLLEQIS